MNFQQLAFLFSAWQTFIKILKARGSIGLFRGWTLMSIIINYWIHFLYTASNSWKLFLTFLLRAVLQSGLFLYRVLTCMDPISVVSTGHIIWLIYCLYDSARVTRGLQWILIKYIRKMRLPCGLLFIRFPILTNSDRKTSNQKTYYVDHLLSNVFCQNSLSLVLGTYYDNKL